MYASLFCDMLDCSLLHSDYTQYSSAHAAGPLAVFFHSHLPVISEGSLAVISEGAQVS